MTVRVSIIVITYKNKGKNFVCIKGDKTTMLTITARLFKDGQLVGYRITDEQQTQDLTKAQLWVYAKNKQINNIMATGTQENPIISGTNGFELKKLPDINISQEEQFDKAIKPELTHSNSVSLEVVGKLINSRTPRTEGRTEGYAIRNRGNVPIIVTRSAYRTGIKSTVQLNPGDTIYLNRTETTLLACTKEVQMHFYNGKMYMAGRGNSLDSFFIKPIGEPFPELITEDTVNPDELARYFGYTIRNKKDNSSLFEMFKRQR